MGKYQKGGDPDDRYPPIQARAYALIFPLADNITSIERLAFFVPEL
jgi:hypothetical protein